MIIEGTSRALGLAAVLAWCIAAHGENKEVARDAFHQATLQYDLGDFKAALAQFKLAYLNYEDPAFLFNIAQCQRQLGDKAEALRTYRVFLSKVPNAPQRQQVDKLIAELQSAIDHDKAAATNPPTGTIAPDRKELPPAPPKSAAPPPPSAQAQTEASRALVASRSPPERPRSLTRKGWFWGVIAGGAVVVAGAVTLGVVLGTRGHSYVELTY